MIPSSTGNPIQGFAPCEISAGITELVVANTDIEAFSVSADTTFKIDDSNNDSDTLLAGKVIVVDRRRVTKYIFGSTATVQIQRA